MNNILKFTSGLILASSALFGETSVKPNGCTGPVLCPIAPMDQGMDCCKRAHIDIGLLYQQPAFPFMMPAVKGVYGLPPVKPTSNDDVNELAEWMFQCFDYTLGLTASLGYFMEHDNWYAEANLDWISSTLNRNYSLNDNPGDSNYQNLPEFYGSYYYKDNYKGLESLQTAFYTTLHYKASFDLYALTVLLSRGSYHSKSYSFEPYAAIHALWFDNYQKTNYYHSEDNQNGLYEIDKKNWGAGPMFGLNGEYLFTNCLSLFSDSNVSFLYGESLSQTISNYKSFDDDADLALDDDDYTTETMDIHCQYFLPMRSIIGLKFAKYCYEGKYHLAVKLGYDVRVVFSYPAMDRGFAMNGLYANLIWNF